MRNRLRCPARRCEYLVRRGRGAWRAAWRRAFRPWPPSAPLTALWSSWSAPLRRRKGCGPKENARYDIEGVGELHQYVHAQVDDGALDSLLVRQIKLCRFSKRLLGEPEPSTEAPHIRGDVPKGLGCPGARHPVRLPGGCDRNKSTKSSLR